MRKMNKFKYIFFSVLALVLMAIPALAQAGAADNEFTVGSSKAIGGRSRFRYRCRSRSYRSGDRWFKSGRRRSTQSGRGGNGSNFDDYRARADRIARAVRVVIVFVVLRYSSKAKNKFVRTKSKTLFAFSLFCYTIGDSADNFANFFESNLL